MPQGAGHLFSSAFMSSFQTLTLWQPKAGNAENEYEDAYGATKRPDRRGRMALAIADGATETLLSRQWANLLVKRFVRGWSRADALQTWVADTMRAWQHEKRTYLEGRERAGKPIQWYEEPGLEAGAFAALLGIVIERDSHNWRWQAAALGDCCLVQVRDNAVCGAFPLQGADAFNNRPLLLSSNPAKNRGVVESFVFARGMAQRGDRMYLMTDALAAWFFRAHEAGELPWNELDVFQRADAFAAWVSEKRAAHAMRNDDVTLMRLIWK